MTDAYEDVYLPQELLPAKGGAMPLDEAAANSNCNKSSPPLHTSPNFAASETWETRLKAAEKRREEFRVWLLHKARKRNLGNLTAVERAAAEDRRTRRLEKLEGRLAAAEANRAATLARRQRRAAATNQRREDAAERVAAAVAERSWAASERLEADLAAAESRRMALREAERERLRAEHELVLNRLAASQERTATVHEQQRSRLEAKLTQAASEREARLARRAARAAARQVERARNAGATTGLEEGQQEDLAGSQDDDRGQVPAAPEGDPYEGDVGAAPTLLPGRRAPPAAGGPEAAREAAAGRVATPAEAADALGEEGGEEPTSSELIGEVEEEEEEEEDESEEEEEEGNAEGVDERDLGRVEGGYSGGAGEDNNGGGDGTATGSLEALLRSLSSRRLQRGWRAWVAGQRTTRELAEAFVATGVTGLGTAPPAAPPVSGRASASTLGTAASGGGSGRGRAAAAPLAPTVVIGHLGGAGAGGGNGEPDDDFDRFAAALRSPATLKATQAFLRRLEQRLTARTEASVRPGPANQMRSPDLSPAGKGLTPLTHGSHSPSNTTALLRRLNPRAPRDARLERYPPRVLLCAFMIVRHPEVVFSGSGAREAALAAAARRLVTRLEALLERILLAPIPSPQRHPVQPYSNPPLLPYDPAQRSPAAAALLSSPPSAWVAVPCGGGGGGGGGSLPDVHVPPFMPLSPVGRGLQEFMRKRRVEAEAAAAASTAAGTCTAVKTSLERGALKPGPAGPEERPRSSSPDSDLAPACPTRAVGSETAATATSTAFGIAATASDEARQSTAVLDASEADPEAEAEVECTAAAMSPHSSMSYATIGSLVLQFDEAWLRYLDQFVTWKGADAAALESELVRCAAALESSMLRKCRGDPASERVARSSDLRAVIAQVAHDQELLRERVAKLGGEAGLRRLEAALAQARRAVAEELATRGSPGPSSANPSSASEVDTTDAESSSSVTTSPRPRRPPPLSPTRTTNSRTPATFIAPPAPSNGLLSSPSAAAVEAAAAAASSLSPGPPPGQPAPPDPALGGNAALVHQVLLAAAANTGPYRLPSSEAEAAWARAVAAVELDTGVVGLAVLPPGPDPEELRAMGQEQLIRTLRSRTAAIAECAFWDNVTAALAVALAPEGGGDVSSSGGGGGDRAGRSISNGGSSSDGSAGGSGGGGGPHRVFSVPVSVRLADLLAPMLSEMAGEVAGVVNSTQQATAIRAQFAEATLRADIAAAAAATAAGGGNATSTATVSAVQPVLAALERLGALLVAAGAPAREADALVAHGSMRRRLSAALAAIAVPAAATGRVVQIYTGDAAAPGSVCTAAGVSTLAAALGAAVRLLSAQIKLLRLDAANGRLQALAASLHGDGAVSYLRTKFATIFRLAATNDPEPAAGTCTTAPSASASSAAPPSAAPPPPSLRQSLPRTADWLHRSHATAASLRSYIQAQGIDIMAAVSAAASAATAVPGNLRSGLRQVPGGGTEAATTAMAALRASVTPVLPVGPLPDVGVGGSWRWLLRAGFVGLLCGDMPAVGPSLAETLVWEGERLHAAQNEFQQLVVVTAGILLVSQLRSSDASTAATAATAATAPAVPWGPEARSSAARRLLVLAADPGMRLPHLTSELASLAGVAGDEAAEGRLRSAFMSFMNPGSAPFRSITTALAAALLLHLTLGPPSSFPSSHPTQPPVGPPAGSYSPSSPAAAAAVLLLGRVGASGLAGDVAALGERLMAVVAVNEAVHGELYERLHGEIVQQEAQERETPNDDNKIVPVEADEEGLHERLSCLRQQQHVITLQAQHTPSGQGEGSGEGRQHGQVPVVGLGATAADSNEDVGLGVEGLGQEGPGRVDEQSS